MLIRQDWCSGEEESVARGQRPTRGSHVGTDVELVVLLPAGTTRECQPS